MPEEEKKETTSLITGPDADILAQLRANSGEASGSAYPFVPLIKVDNGKEETEINGRPTKVLCAPQLKRTDKNGEEYINTVMPNFGGVILLIKWRVENMGKWDANKKEYVSNGAPFFSSRQFDPVCLFGKKAIDIKYKESGEIESLNYPTLKAKYDKLFKLSATLYVLYGHEIVRVSVAGASRSALFDLLNEIKGNDSVSAHKVVFGAKYVSDVENPYNTLTIDIKDDADFTIDWQEVLTSQAELKDLFSSQKIDDIAEAVGGEIVDSMPEDEIKVEAIPFN